MNNRIWHTLVWLVPIIALAIIFRDAVFLNHLYYDGDTVLNFFPYFDFFASGGGVRVTQQILSGFPAHVSVTGIWFYPVNLLFLSAFDAFNAYVYLILANLLLTYFFSYRYFRIIGLRAYTAVFSSLVFLFSGQLMIWSTTNANTNYFFLLPLTLFVIELIQRTATGARIIRRLLLVVLLGVVLGVGWLSGHIQFIVYIHSFAALYYLFIWFRDHRQSARRVILGIWSVVTLAAAYIISAAIGSRQIAAILGFSGLSARADGVSVSEFFAGSYLPQDLIHYVLPFWTNPLIKTGIPNLYIGLLPLLLLILAFVLYRKITHSYFRFFFWIFVAALFSGITYSPLGLAFHVIPLLNAFRAIPRIMFLGNFAAAATVGFTIEYIITHRSIAEPLVDRALHVCKRLFLFVFIPVVAIVSIGKLFFTKVLQQYAHAQFLDRFYSYTSGLPVDHYLRLIDQYIESSLDQLFIGNQQVIIVVVFGILSFLLLKRIWKMQPVHALALCVLVLGFNISAVYAYRFDSVSRSELLEPSATATHILSASHAQEPSRVFSLFPGMTEFNELTIACGTTNVHEVMALQKALLTPNMNMLYDIDSVDGYDNFMPERMAQFLAYIGSERATAGQLLSQEPISLEERIGLFADRKNVLRSMNVRYVLSGYEIHDEDFVEVLHTQVGNCNTGVYVYELTDYWPRYFVASSVEAVSPYDFDTVISRLHLAHERGKVFVEQMTDGRSQITDGIVPVDAMIDGDTMYFNVSINEDSLLFIGNAWLPGWQATVDGEPAEIIKTNYVYMGVWLEPGTHEVTFTYLQ